MGIFDKKTTTNTSNTTNATQTNVNVGDGGFLLGDGSQLTYSADQSTTLIDSRDLSTHTQLNDSRDQSLTYTDQSVRYDLSAEVAKDALDFASRQNELNAGLWNAANSEAFSVGLNYSKLSGEAYKDANASILNMATLLSNKTGEAYADAMGAVVGANQSDGAALAGSLEKFGKMGVVLIIGVALIGALRGNRG